ncbi:polysaccharide biosynthesis protein [Microbacterium sp. HM58-2]|nr:polysaccharide biosynthesis protein [Microbacterium sp. HM58-2]
MSPLLTRLYSADDFGLLALVTALSAVLGGFASLAFEAAVPIAKTNREAGALMLLGTACVAVMSLAVAAIALLLRQSLATWFDSVMVAEFWWLIPSTVLTVGMFNVVSSWAIRRGQYRTLGARNALQGLAQVIWSVTLGLLGPKFGFALASSLGVGRLSGAVAAGRQPARLMWRALRERSTEVWRVARLYRRFPLVLSWSRLINGLGLQLPVVLIAWWYGAYELGLFALTMRVISGPVGMLADAVAQYFEGAFASRLQTGDRLRPLIIKIGLAMAVIALPPAVLLWAVAPDLYAVLFGESWRASGELARAVALMFVFQLAVSPLSRALPLLERHATQVTWDLMRLFLVVVGIVLPAETGAPLATALWGMTAAQCLSYLVMLGLLFAVTRSGAEGGARAAK